MRCTVQLLFSIFGLSASGAADDKSDLAMELKKFQGAWTFESVEAGGQKLPAEQFKGMKLVFVGEKYTVKSGDMVITAATMTLDLSKSPRTMDCKVTEGPNKGTVILGIYEINADTLKVCFDPDGKKRPTEFKADTGSQTLVVHKRVKK